MVTTATKGTMSCYLMVSCFQAISNLEQTSQAGTYTCSDQAGTYTCSDQAGTYTCSDQAGTYTCSDQAGTYTCSDQAGTYTYSAAHLGEYKLPIRVARKQVVYINNGPLSIDAQPELVDTFWTVLARKKYKRAHWDEKEPIGIYVEWDEGMEWDGGREWNRTMWNGMKVWNGTRQCGMGWR